MSPALLTLPSLQRRAENSVKCKNHAGDGQHYQQCLDSYTGCPPREVTTGKHWTCPRVDEQRRAAVL